MRRAIALACLALTALAHAEQDSDNNTAGGLNVSVQLRHRVVIPRILYFRVGNATFGSVDEVQFDIAASPGYTTGTITQSSTDIPLGNSSPIEATSNGTLDVDIRSNVGTVNISYTVSDPQGLADGSGNFIPFGQIETQASDAGLPAPVLDNAGAPAGSANSVDVTGNLYGGRVVNRQATWTYVYLNELTPMAGTYEGRVTYTASAP